MVCMKTKINLGILAVTASIIFILTDEQGKYPLGMHMEFKEAVLRANGRLIEQLRVPLEIVEEALAVIGSGEGKFEAASE